MASAREKFNSKGGGVPSLFAHTIKDTQKLGERRFPSKNKYIKNDITISKGIESRDSDLEGFGDVIKKVKKEDVQVPAGAIRKHKMVKQISGRFNGEGKKKGFDIFALIDDAIVKEPTEEAKEKARERAAAKNAVHEPIPPRLVPKKQKSAQPTPPTVQTQSKEAEITTKSMDQPDIDRRAADVSETPIHVASDVPAMFATSSTGSTPKREPAWKLRLQDKKSNAPLLAKENNPSEDQVDKATTPLTVVRTSPSTAPIPSQFVEPQDATSNSECASSPVAVIRDIDSPKEDKVEFKDGQEIFTKEINASAEDGLGFSPHVAVTKNIDARDEAKTDVIDVSPPVAVALALAEETPKHGLEDDPPTVVVSKDIPVPKGANLDFNGAPVPVAVTREIKPTQKEPAWKLRLQERQAASSSEIDASKGTSVDSAAHNAEILPANAENPTLKKEPAWKLRLHERQAASTITEPVAPINRDESIERGVILEGGNMDAQNDQLNLPPKEAPNDDDDFSVSISSVESDQSHNEPISGSGVSYAETAEQVVSHGSQKETETCAVKVSKGDVENSAPLSEKNHVAQQFDTYDDPKSYSVQHIECAVENTTNSAEKSSMVEQSIGTAASSVKSNLGEQLTSLKAEPVSLPLKLAKYRDESDSDVSDSSSDDDLRIARASHGTAKRNSDLSPEVTRSVQPPKFAIGSTVSGIPLTEKVDALLARSIPLVPPPGTVTVTGSPSDKLEWLREHIKETEKKVQSTLVDAKLQVAELRKLFDNEKETMLDDFEERIRVQRRVNLEQDKKNEKLLNEEKKIVESLRAENKTLRANVERMPKQMAEMKQSIANLEAANEDIAATTEDLSRFSKKLETDHDKLMESSRQCRDIYLPRYRKELRDRQMALDTETRIKNLYRDCAIKIAKHVGESSRRPDLIEDINALVLETEAEVNPKFDPRVLVASDSDSSSSSDSDDSSDSDSSRD